jgi:hypothetical protein
MDRQHLPPVSLKYTCGLADLVVLAQVKITNSQRILRFLCRFSRQRAATFAPLPSVREERSGPFRPRFRPPSRPVRRTEGLRRRDIPQTAKSVAFDRFRTLTGVGCVTRAALRPARVPSTVSPGVLRPPGDPFWDVDRHQSLILLRVPQSGRTILLEGALRFLSPFPFVPPIPLPRLHPANGRSQAKSAFTPKSDRPLARCARRA